MSAKRTFVQAARLSLTTLGKIAYNLKKSKRVRNADFANVISEEIS